MGRPSGGLRLHGARLLVSRVSAGAVVASALVGDLVNQPIHTPTPFEVEQGSEFYLKDRPKRNRWTQQQVEEEIRMAFVVGCHWVVRRQMGTQGRKT